MAEIHRRHFHTVAARLRYGADLEDILQEVLRELPAAVGRVRGRLPKGSLKELQPPCWLGFKVELVVWRGRVEGCLPAGAGNS